MRNKKNKKIYIPIWLDLLYFFNFFSFSYVCIYIPIWLDLLLIIPYLNNCQVENLHSNMVRFIIYNNRTKMIEFIFDLHSNMVRFIIIIADDCEDYLYIFTFQYG